MSVLLGHAKAARALAEAFAFEANECGDDRNGLLLARISAAYSRGARNMDDAAKAEALAGASGDGAQ